MELEDNKNYLEYLNTVTIIKNKTIQKQVYKILLNMILKGIMHSNQSISEVKIANALNISKSPVRESLKMLENKQLVKIVPNSKSYIMPIDLKKIYNSAKIREALELLIVEEAINNINDEDIKSLELIIKQQESAIKNSKPEEFFYYDEVFHNKIIDISKIPEALNIIEDLKIHINRIRFANNYNCSGNPSILVDHKNILNAIKAKDVVIARLFTSIHLSKVLNLMLNSSNNS